MLVLAKRHCRIPQARKFTDKNVVDRTNVKAKLYRHNHTKKHTHTQSLKEEKKNVYIYKKRKSATKSIIKSTNDTKL